MAGRQDDFPAPRLEQLKKPQDKMRTTKVYKLVIHKKGFGGSGQYWLVFGDCVNWPKLWCAQYNTINALTITNITNWGGQVNEWSHNSYQENWLHRSRQELWKAFTFRFCLVLFWILVLLGVPGSSGTPLVAQAGLEPIIFLSACLCGNVLPHLT